MEWADLWNQTPHSTVLKGRNLPVHNSMSTRVWIPIGAGLFLVALAVSALAVPQLRLLHLLQAFIYVAVVILARRGNA